MVRIDTFIKSKQTKLVYSFIQEPLESWNAIGKYWLRKFDDKYNDAFFVWKCSSLNGLDMNQLPQVYQKIINTWSGFIQNVDAPLKKSAILNTIIFGNSSIRFKNKPLFYFSFLKSDITTVQDIWNSETTYFISCSEIYRKLIDRRIVFSNFQKLTGMLEILCKF